LTNSKNTSFLSFSSSPPLTPITLNTQREPLIIPQHATCIVTLTNAHCRIRSVF
ncbi:unnamed protein product, partial [Sphagnum tenellum]